VPRPLEVFTGSTEGARRVVLDETVPILIIVVGHAVPVPLARGHAGKSAKSNYANGKETNLAFSGLKGFSLTSVSPFGPSGPPTAGSNVLQLGPGRNGVGAGEGRFP
jgi:hypothetical protein